MNTSRLGARPARRAWTTEQVKALGVRTDLVTACKVVYGCGKNRAWEMYRGGELDFPALRCGRRVVVPVQPLLELLGLADQPTAHSRPALTVVRPPGDAA